MSWSSSTTSLVESSSSPAARCRAASTTSLTRTDLWSTPAAPASTARAYVSRSAVAVRTSTAPCGLAARSSPISSVPSPSGRSRSTTARSMFSSTRRASDRDPACATTSNSGSRANMKASGSRKVAWSSTSRTRFTERFQLETEHGSSPRGRIQRQLAAVGLQDAPAQVEAQPHAGHLPAGSVATPAELLEDQIQVIGVYACASIGHLDPDTPGGLPGSCPQLDRCAVGRVLGGVGEEVPEHLPDPVRVCAYLPVGDAFCDESVATGERLGERRGVFQKRADPDSPGLYGEVFSLDGGGCSHVGDQRLQQIGLLLDLVEGSGLLGEGDLTGGQHVGVPADYRERRVELVGDHRGEVGLEDRELLQVPVGLLYLLFGPLALGDVVDGADHLERLALLATHHLRPAVCHPHLPVRSDDAVLEVVGLPLIERVVQVLPESLPVLRVHHLYQPVQGGHELPGLVTVDAEDLVGPVHLFGHHIPLPVAEVGYALRFCQAGLALVQSLLRPPELGDVSRHRAQRRLTAVGEHRRAGVDDHYRAVLVSIPPLAHAAPPLLEATLDVSVYVFPLVGYEVVDLHVEELLFGVAHHLPEGCVGLEDALGLGVVEIDGFHALLHHRPVARLGLL